MTGLFLCMIYDRSEDPGGGKIYLPDQDTRVAAFTCRTMKVIRGGWIDIETHLLLFYGTMTTDFLFMGTHHSRLIGVQKE